MKHAFWFAILLGCFGCSLPNKPGDGGTGHEPTTCSLIVSPTIGTRETEFTLDLASNGVECVMNIDGVEAGSASCTGQGVPLPTPFFGVAPSVGSHTVSMRVQGGPGGPVACSAPFALQASDTTTCSIAINPPQGSTSSTFNARFSSNGTACTWALDGIDKGALPCAGPVRAFSAAELGGKGNHVITLNVVAGPGGMAHCNSEVAVTPASSTSCFATLTPNIGTESTAFSLLTQTSGSGCTWSIDGVNQGPIACANTGRALSSADLGGPGVHTVVLMVGAGPSGVAQCSSTVRIEGSGSLTTCGVQVEPSVGGTGVPFTIETTSNGVWCSWSLDGVSKGAIACNGANLSVTAAELGGNGAHDISLLADGPDGQSSCEANVTIISDDTTSCEITASPSSGNTTTVFSISALSNGTGCSYQVDGAGPVSVDCDLNGLPMTAANLGGAGTHVVTFEVQDGPGGPMSCSTSVTVGTGTTTCGLTVTPSTGALTTTFRVQASSNGSSCTYAVDGMPKGLIPCMGSVILTGANLNGLGAHLVTLYTTGPSGPTSCSAPVTVMAPLPTCSVNISPASGTTADTFTASWSSNATQCSWKLDGVNKGVIPCTSSDSIPGSVFGAGTHTLVFTATGPTGTSTCQDVITVALPLPTCSVSLSPTTGRISTNTSFTATWNSDGTTCTYDKDNSNQGSINCVGTTPLTASFFGIGTHTVRLHTTGAGGTRSCVSNAVTVSP